MEEYKRLNDLVKGQGIDVGLLVLNAGVMKHTKFIDANPKDI